MAGVMKKFRLLIIDDQVDHAPAGEIPRRDAYKHLEEDFDLTFLGSLRDLPKVIGGTAYHAVLLDFVLARWGTTAKTVLPMLDPSWPVALISQYWGPNFEDLRVVMAAHKQISILFTWEDLQVAERRHMVVLWLDKAIRESQHLAVACAEPDDPIRILQLSDLQFGSELPEGFAAETELTAQAIKRQWDGPPHFIAITGDIAERGMPADYAQALEWLNAFAKKLDANWSNERFLVIPGNHDVCWPLGWSSHIDTKERHLNGDGQEVNSGLRQFALAPFRRFASELGGLYPWSGDGHYWVSGKYRQMGFVFFGYNTCERMNEWSKPTQQVGDETVAKLFAEVTKYCYEANNVLVVGLMHHPVASGEHGDAIVNRETFFKNVSNMSSTLVTLCGHVHSEGYFHLDSGGARILEVAASTTTKLRAQRPEDSTRGYNMIELQRRDNQVTGLTVTFCRYERSRLSVARKVAFLRDAKGRFVRESEV